MSPDEPERNILFLFFFFAVLSRGSRERGMVDEREREEGGCKKKDARKK